MVIYFNFCIDLLTYIFNDLKKLLDRCPLIRLVQLFDFLWYCVSLSELHDDL